MNLSTIMINNYCQHLFHPVCLHWRLQLFFCILKWQYTSNFRLSLKLDDTWIQVIQIIIYDNYVIIFAPIGQFTDEMSAKKL